MYDTIIINMKTTDGQVDYYIDIVRSSSIDLPTYRIPESHIKANLDFTSVKPKPLKRIRKRKL